MTITEKHNYEFKAQLEATNKLHSLKCELLEKDPDTFEPYLRIKAEHLKPLFDTEDNEQMRGEYENDTLYLSMTFNTEGTFFECAYFLDLNTGEVRFAMDKPLIVLNEFVIPAEFDDDLKERIKELIRQGKNRDSFNDERLDQYFNDKFLGVFIDYVDYMERLIHENKCNECIQRFKYRICKFCKEFYSKDKCKL